MQRDAEDLIQSFGVLAYWEACSRAESRCRSGDAAGFRYWRQVARFVAKGTQLRPEHRASGHDELAQPSRRRARHEAMVASHCEGILADLKRVAHSGDETDLHQLKARILQAASLAPGQPAPPTWRPS
jgi:hypothetical protein